MLYFFHYKQNVVLSFFQCFVSITYERGHNSVTRMMLLYHGEGQDVVAEQMWLCQQNTFYTKHFLLATYHFSS